MTQAECQTALEKGYQLARAASREGSNVLALGEMGIGNSSAAALLVSKLLPAPLASCIGPGTGLAGEALTGKQIVLEQVLAQHEEATSPLAVLAAVGGFELAMMAGAFIGGAEQGMVLLVDGFIASASWLAAERLCPGLLPYSVLAHLAAEPGHQVLIDAMALPQPLLQLDLRLGEGSGAALAYPLLRSAVAMLNELAPFDSRAEA
jgi:nicotinate-nucleotide--dimethylbenzimidazole phosphoribosyltransferase